MEKTNRRVQKGFMIGTLIILLAVIAIAGYSKNNHEESKHEVVYDDNFFKTQEKKMKEVIKKIEQEKDTKEKESLALKVTPLKMEEVIAEDQWETYVLTHYTATCKGCSGFTRTEIDVRNTTEYLGYKVLSVDKKKIPLGSIVEIKDGDSTYQAMALDTGGAIKGNKLDLLVGSHKEAINLGKKNIKLRVVRSGWEDEKSKR